MMFKLKRYYQNNFLFVLLLLSPIIDNINGYFILSHGSSGVSIGTFYRLCIIIYCLSQAARIKKYFFAIYAMMYFPIIAFFKSMVDKDFIGDFTYAMKWVMVVLVFLTLMYKYRKDPIASEGVKKVLSIWSLLVPSFLIIEYVLNIGQRPYGEVGFKGLYYSTNDLAYVLIMLFIFCTYQLMRSFQLKWILLTSINMIAIIILSTKSSVFFAIISFIILFLVSSNSAEDLIKKILLLIAVIIIVIWGGSILNNNISDFFNRYSDMWMQSQTTQNWWTNFFNFITSNRTSRIHNFVSQFGKGYDMINILFGWIKPDNANVVEMDFNDLLYQYGILGFGILIYIYIKFANLKIKKHFILNYIMLVSIIYTVFAGHVISGAFSGTMFAMIYFLFSINADLQIDRSDKFNE